ncbi:helix-turn-helix transcriptional regulator [Mammaliicoccus stepanovicii]|uniref:Transcriptional regulator, PBSX family n=1 Tax=Mammaliicoccus stepanovicii TaxID=643214 RepID=A0A239X8Y7_9STAP|nr:helix-turn-helix transcriptional regulator [Mammaliicoccus stepanovicii]PNZ77774.1 transcriptional regulator [Mammaliicoccus stepanovicii]GGI42879.1 transcriptional regulator [Mammaliicoccus stepanovicii]SNV42870.1 transcriptional regulator, PBSX family [Mammaliicoccus stepanovicii]
MKNRVYEYRTRMNMTQSELSRIVNVSRQTINSIERSKFNPTLVLAHKLSQIFEITIDDLFIFEDDENINFEMIKYHKKEAKHDTNN